MLAHRALVLALSLGLACSCQSTPDSPAQVPAPATPPPTAQAGPEWIWAGVELIGLANIERAEVLVEINLELGAPYTIDPVAWKALEERLVDRFGCIKANVSAVSYPNFKAYMVVDLLHKGDEALLDYKARPTGNIPLANRQIIDFLEQLLALQDEYFQSGKPSRVKTGGGYMAFEDSILHELAKILHELVPEYRLNLIAVLHGDSDASKRSMAATLLNWAGSAPDSIARVIECTRDADTSVRNEVTNFIASFLTGVDSPQVRQKLIASLSAQLKRPSHSDRNKAVYGLLHMMMTWPTDGPDIEAAAGDTLRAIARDSVLFNVADPARELLALLGTT